MEEQYIVCINRAGIGNRLRGLVSAIRLSKILNRRLLLYWEKNQYCGCNFNDLFENIFDEVDKKFVDSIKNKYNARVYRDVLNRYSLNYDYIILDTWKWVFFPGEVEMNFNKTYSSKGGANVDFEFDRIPVNLRKELLKELKLLIPVQEVFDKIKDFENCYKIKEYNGMHIRRGDNIFTTDGREKVSSDEKFEKIIEENPNEKFFISTDSVQVAKNISTKYNDKLSKRIIYYPEMDKKRSEKESIQEALAAIILLSKTKKLYGSFLSTFTEIIWWFNGCNMKVSIVGKEDVNKDFSPKSFPQKVFRKLNYYKVNLLRKAYGVYK